MPALGLAPVLGIVFIVLKLTEVIAWSWLWVLAPFWIPALFALIVLFCMLMAATYATVKAQQRAEKEDNIRQHMTDTGFDRYKDLW